VIVANRRSPDLDYIAVKIHTRSLFRYD